MGNTKGDAVGGYIYCTGISPYYGNAFSGVQFSGTFGEYNYTDEFIVTDELKIEHMDIETGEIEFKRNPNYIKFYTSMDTTAILKANFS